MISHYRINYRQLITANKPNLILNITALSKNDLTFYYLNITRTKHNNVLTTLLLHTLFNKLLQKQLTHQNQRLPKLNTLLKQINHLLHQTNLPKQFPLLINYYHRKLKNLILISTNLNTTLNTDEHQIQINNNIPLNTLNNTYLNQLNQRYDT